MKTGKFISALGILAVAMAAILMGAGTQGATPVAKAHAAAAAGSGSFQAGR
jgi:hypothetical protein